MGFWQCLKGGQTQLEGYGIIVTKIFHGIYKFVIWVSVFFMSFMSYIVMLENGAPKFYGLFNKLIQKRFGVV